MRDRPKLKNYGEKREVYPACAGSTRGELAGKEHARLPCMRGDRPIPPKVNLFESRLPRMRIDPQLFF